MDDPAAEDDRGAADLDPPGRDAEVDAGADPQPQQAAAGPGEAAGAGEFGAHLAARAGREAGAEVAVGIGGDRGAAVRVAGAGHEALDHVDRLAGQRRPGGVDEAAADHGAVAAGDRPGRGSAREGVDDGTVAAAAAVRARAAREDQRRGAEAEGDLGFALDRVVEDQRGAAVGQVRGRVARRVEADGAEFVGAVGEVVGVPAGDEPAVPGCRWAAARSCPGCRPAAARSGRARASGPDSESATNASIRSGSPGSPARKRTVGSVSSIWTVAVAGGEKRQAAVAGVADRVAPPVDDPVGALAGHRGARRGARRRSGGAPSTPIAVTGPPGPSAAIPERGSEATRGQPDRPRGPSGRRAAETHLRRRPVDPELVVAVVVDVSPEPETATAWT